MSLDQVKTSVEASDQLQIYHMCTLGLSFNKEDLNTSHFQMSRLSDVQTKECCNVEINNLKKS